MAPNLSNDAIATIVFGILATLLALITLVLPCCVFRHLPTIGQAFRNGAMPGRYLSNVLRQASNSIPRRQHSADLEANLGNIAPTPGGSLVVVPLSDQGGSSSPGSLSVLANNASTLTASTTTSAVASY